MFLRKLTVLVVPLLLCAVLCVFLPVLNGRGFWGNVGQGLLMGCTLALLLPLSGASRRREPFAGLLWAPLTLLVLTVIYQYLSAMGLWSVPALSFLTTTSGQTVLVECVFVGFLAVQTIRTQK